MQNQTNHDQIFRKPKVLSVGIDQLQAPHKAHSAKTSSENALTEKPVI